MTDLIKFDKLRKEKYFNLIFFFFDTCKGMHNKTK